ncbi:DUF2092 domain-containing protein [Streptomyces sp. JJ36]|uniref:LolA family protein n=1 Tax=Streptomyces sp. JJ36 TaxID=2736645 RepID=UPI001F325E30|nr:DUF2092 domain-containing protein [Streptomyces sp. JJ36]MCF6524494.1 outer membrane lipoprotein carrier protein LolA [Streptomyces sp. JJ36]
MAQIQPIRAHGKLARYGVPVAVAGVAAATIGLVPALADSGDPDLPKISAEELIAKMAESGTDRLSGTVKVTTDLGLPALPGAAGGGGFGGGPGEPSGQGAEGSGEEGSPAAPQRKLAELASGEHTLRVAADGPEKQRLSIVEDAAEYSLIRNGNEVWAYDSASNSVFHGVGPEDAGAERQRHEELPGGLGDLTPQEAADRAVAAVGDSTTVTVDGTAKVAGRDAYQLLIKPKAETHSTVGAVRIAVDAEKSVPLKFTLTPRGGGEAAVDIGYTTVDFGKPDADTFRFSPPEGADVTEKRFTGEERQHRGDRKGEEPRSGLSGLEIIGEDWNTVAELEFPEGQLGRPGDRGPEGLDDPRAKRLLDAFTDEVRGDFGTGRVFESTLFNALLTEDGTVYAGAVTKEGLIEAAEKGAQR